MKIFDCIDRLSGAMSFHRDRGAVLAGNIANIETPNYRAVELARTGQDGVPEGGLALHGTDPRHITGGDGDASATGTRVFDSSGALGADGNGVDMDRELAKLDANRVRYGTSAELASRRLALLRYGAGDGS